MSVDTASSRSACRPTTLVSDRVSRSQIKALMDASDLPFKPNGDLTINSQTFNIWDECGLRRPHDSANPNGSGYGLWQVTRP